jgi:Kef-type K+ transport system membrane component KefB
MSWSFSPFEMAQTVQWNALLLFGSLLLGGLVGGHVASKNPWIPRITGYLLVGFLLGAGGLNWLSGDVLRLSSVFADLALALMVYQLGRYVDIGWLRYEKWLVVTVLTSAMLCFLFVWMSLEWFGTGRAPAMLAGVFAIGIAPTVVMVVVRDLGAEGHVTRRLAAMTALTNLLALLAAYALFPIVAIEPGMPWVQIVGSALYSLSGSVLLAYFTYRLMIPLACMLGRQRSGQFVLVIAIIALVIGAAHALHLPVLLTMLAFAIFSKNLDLEYHLMELEFGVASELFVALLFVTIGASIRLSDLTSAGLAVAILIGARFAAMSLSIFAFARPAKLNWTQASVLMLGALPLAETGLALAQISSLYPQTAASVAPLLAGSLVVLELFGPIATQFALIKSGEGGHHRPQPHA